MEEIVMEELKKVVDAIMRQSFEDCRRLADVCEFSRVSCNMLPHMQHVAAILELRVALRAALRAVQTADSDNETHSSIVRLSSLIAEAKNVLESTEAFVAYVEATTN